MNFFSFMPPQVYLHDAGVSSDKVTYVSKYDLVSMNHEEFAEFQRLLSDLTHVPGLTVLYDPDKQRWSIAYGIPTITTMEDIQVEYPEHE